MKDPTLEDYCDRCGAFATGRWQWMFHRGELPRQEFFCDRCQRVLRIYGVIGLSLLALILGAFIVATWWLSNRR